MGKESLKVIHRPARRLIPMNPPESALRPEIVPSKVRRVILPSQDPPASAISAEPPRLAVVIVNYNGWPDVASLVASLAAEPEVGSGRAEVIVVDNASVGPIPADLDPPPRGVRLVLRADNGGFSAGVNAGWRTSRAPWVLLMNPDVAIDAGRIGRVLGRIDAFEARPEGPPGVVGFGLRNADGSPQPSVGAEPRLVRSLWGQFIPRSRRKYQPEWRTRPGPVSWVTGACLLVDSRLMAELGGMDERFFLYYEEVALCVMARTRGRSVEFDPSVTVRHLKPLQDRAISPRIRVFTRHGKLLFFREFRPRWEFRALCAIIRAEAAIRGAISRLRGDRESRGAWKAIGAIAAGFRRGEPLFGTDVRDLASASTATPTAIPSHHLQRLPDLEKRRDGVSADT